jgi:hypothetical protein
LTKTIKKTIKKYKNFKDTYKYAYVGFPKGFAGIKKAFFGSFQIHIKSKIDQLINHLPKQVFTQKFIK